LKEEALDRPMWRTRFGRDFGTIVRQTAEWMNDSASVSRNSRKRIVCYIIQIAIKM
jgi:hypothetical protein